MFVTALALHMYSTEPEETCNLPRLYELLTLGDRAAPKDKGKLIDPFEWLLFKMSKNRAFGNAIPAAAESLVRVSQGNTFGSVLITIAVELKWLADPLVARTLTHSTFFLQDFKTGEGELNLFIGLPVGDAKGHMASYITLLVKMGLYLMERTPPRKAKQKTVFVIDEVAAGLEEIGSIAAPLLSGYGAEVIIATQGIPLLAATYPNHWKDILGNAELVYWMGLNDPESPKVLQAMLGTHRRIERIKGGWFSKEPPRLQVTEYPLMDEEQIRRYQRPSSGRIIVTRFGARPIKATNVPFYFNLPVWLHDPDSDWGERWPRRLMRRIYDRLTAEQQPLNSPDEFTR